jgi:hypothetical protein
MNVYSGSSLLSLHDVENREDRFLSRVITCFRDLEPKGLNNLVLISSDSRGT